MVKKRIKTKNRGILFGVMIGFGISVISMILLSVIASIIVYTQSDPLAIIDIVSLVVLLLSAALSGFTISKCTGEKKILVSTLSALALCLILFMVGTIATGGRATIQVLINYICYIGITVLFAWLGAREKKNRKRR